jgi:hypothetical protein
MPPRKKNIPAPAAEPTSVPVAATTSLDELGADVHEDVAKPVKGKREKKSTKHKVVAVITADGITSGGFQTDVKRPIIAHLPIHTSDIQFHDQPFVYDPRPPENFEAFNAGDINPFSEEATYEVVPKTDTAVVSETVDVDEPPKQYSQPSPQPVAHAQSSASHQRREYGPTTLLVQFEATKHSHELPSETNLACFWCCDAFKGRPCIIPAKIVEDVWHVYGNFCTPQCSMAYLLSELLDTHTRWERIALLNRLYSMNTNGRIYPAPSRECLQRFGGPVSLDDFRNICESQRIRVDIHQPPMVSILASMDTKPIDFYETPLRNTFASPYQCSPTKQSDEPVSLKLKRTKPLKDKESTLDACLKLVTTRG